VKSGTTSDLHYPDDTKVVAPMCMYQVVYLNNLNDILSSLMSITSNSHSSASDITESIEEATYYLNCLQ
jgi:hypothetical protein